jgi:hypothetical protein
VRHCGLAFHVPAYLLRLIESYTSDQRASITSGAAHGSILGLWNVSYESLLRLVMPDENHIVGSAYDVAAALIAVRNVEQAKLTLGLIISTGGWYPPASL